ncbi:MAG: tyrosine-type recombinase/integrase [Mycobacteriales bacterium]
MTQTSVNQDGVTKRFTDLVKQAGVRRIRLHDLRHGTAALLIAVGVDIAVISKMLGHSSAAITADIYGHLLEGVSRDAAERAHALVSETRCDQSVTNDPETAGKSPAHGCVSLPTMVRRQGLEPENPLVKSCIGRVRWSVLAIVVPARCVPAVRPAFWLMCRCPFARQQIRQH